jgi:hypothetical protein
MSVSPRQTLWRGCIAPLIGVLLVLGASALAQVRRTTDYSPFINPAANDATYRTFSSGGLAGIAGGVLFQGNARFVRENGTAEPVDSGSLALSVSAPSAVLIKLHETQYKFNLHAGLACPLGKFVRRGGEIAFTIPPDQGIEAFARLKAAGAVRLARYSNPVFAAKEFAGTAFIRLLEKADFADVEPLPRDLEATIADNINRASGTGPIAGEGVYVNSDAQTTYIVYLVDDQPGRGRVEISGVPLKYSWVRRRDGSFGVHQVEAFSQQFSARPSLTVFQSNSQATQYDVVSLYQAAGVFRALHQANANAFSAFVDSACGGRKSPANVKSRAPSKPAKPVPKGRTGAKKAAPRQRTKT